jgi:hypothetical protein
LKRGEKMGKQIRILLIIVIVIAIGIGGYFGYRSIFYSEPEPITDDDGWTKIDQDYKPKNIVEKNIKEGYSNDNLLPILMKNYGNDEELLNDWTGAHYAKKHASHIKSEYKDWMIVDLKYEGKYGKEHIRLLYLKSKKEGWFLADRGMSFWISK